MSALDHLMLDAATLVGAVQVARLPDGRAKAQW
jgi:hypothetical protein